MVVPPLVAALEVVADGLEAPTAKVAAGRREVPARREPRDRQLGQPTALLRGTLLQSREGKRE